VGISKWSLNRPRGASECGILRFGSEGVNLFYLQGDYWGFVSIDEDHEAYKYECDGKDVGSLKINYDEDEDNSTLVEIQLTQKEIESIKSCNLELNDIVRKASEDEDEYRNYMVISVEKTDNTEYFTAGSIENLILRISSKCGRVGAINQVLNS
jgi:hypothetical protein